MNYPFLYQKFDNHYIRQRLSGALILFLLVSVFLLAPQALARKEVQFPSDEVPFRLSFSASMFHDVNQKDIMASLKVWILTVAKDLNIEVDPNPNIKSSIEGMRDFALHNHVSGFAALTPEILELSETFTFDRIAVGQTNGKVTDEYLLLVRADSKITDIEQLKGGSILFLNSSYMSLSKIWLESMLLENGLGTLQTFFKDQQQYQKPSQVVLPVFFKKQQACLIAKENFDIMGELNPQLGKQLRVLQQSPPFVTAGFAFVHHEGKDSYRDEILNAMSNLDSSEAGRQLLTLTQSNSIVTYPISILDDSFALVRKHNELLHLYDIK